MVQFTGRDLLGQVTNKSVTKVQALSKSKNDGWKKQSTSYSWTVTIISGCPLRAVFLFSAVPCSVGHPSAAWTMICSPLAVVLILWLHIRLRSLYLNQKPALSSPFGSFLQRDKKKTAMVFFTFIGAGTCRTDRTFTSAGIKLIENKHVASPLAAFPELKSIAGKNRLLAPASMMAWSCSPVS